MKMTVPQICERYGVTLGQVHNIYSLKEKLGVGGWPPSDAGAIPTRRYILFDMGFERKDTQDAVLHELMHLVRGDVTEEDFGRDEGGLMVLQYAHILLSDRTKDLIENFKSYGWDSPDNPYGEWTPAATATEVWQDLEQLWRKVGCLDDDNLPTFKLPDYSALTDLELKRLIQTPSKAAHPLART